MSKVQRVVFNTEQSDSYDSQQQQHARDKLQPEKRTRGHLMFKYRNKRDRYLKAQSELIQQADDVGLASSVSMRPELKKSHMIHCVANKRDVLPTHSSIYRHRPGEAVQSCPHVRILQLQAHKADQKM